MFYTSYFAKVNYIKQLNYIPISITYSKPKFFEGEHFSEVAPTLSLVQNYKNGLITENEYTDIYNKYLQDNAEKILKIINNKYRNKNVVFICYEGPNKFCHRHILADFLTKNGFITKELVYE